MRWTDVRLALFGSFGYRDIGDEAMLAEDLRYLTEDLGIPRRNLVLFGADPDYVSRHHDHPRELCFSSEALREGRRSKDPFRRLRRRLRRALSPEQRAARGVHAVLITGGGTINTRDAEGASLRRMAELARVFERLGKPVLAQGQTIGPLGVREDHDRIAARFVRGLALLTVRDRGFSRRYLDLIGCADLSVLETFDDAAGLEWSDPLLDAPTRAFLDAGPPPLVFNVTRYTVGGESAMRGQIAVVTALLETYGPRAVFLSHSPEDLGPLLEIKDRLPSALAADVYVPDTREWRAPMLKAVTARACLAVGGRYHFVVFAVSAGTPTVGLAGNHYSFIKQRGFADFLGLGRQIVAPQDVHDPGQVLAAARHALAASPADLARLRGPHPSCLAVRDSLTTLLRIEG